MTTNSLFSSVSDIDDNSSVSDIQVSRLQDEILLQSKGIEAFILDTNQDDDSAPLTVLKSLFGLFKSELSINLTLRKALVEERKKAGLYQSKLQSLFHNLHQLGFNDIRNVDAIISQIKHQSAEVDYFVHNKKKFKRALREERSKMKNLSIHISDIKNELSLKCQNEDELNSTISTLNDKLSKENDEIQNLNQEIIQKRDKIIELEQFCHNLQIKIQDIESEKMTTQNRCANEVSILKVKSDEAKNIYFNKLILLQKEVEKLNQQITEQKERHEKTITDLHTQNFNDIEMIKLELNSKINDLRQEKEKIETVSKQEIENQKRYIDTYSHSLIEKENTIKELNNELLTVKAELEEVEKTQNENQNLSTILINNLKIKNKKLLKKLKMARVRFDDTCQNHQKELKELKNKFDKEKSENEQTITNDWKSRISQLEATVKELRITNDEQKTEINNLRDLVRKLSFNLQQEEAENAQLQASLQMKKFRKHSSPISIQIKSERHQRKSQKADEFSSCYDLSSSLSSSLNDES